MDVGIYTLFDAGNLIALHLNYKIVIAEDDAATAEALTRLFSNMGNSVVCVDKGIACVKTFIQTNPDLVILDINLPDISGYDVASQLNHLPQRANFRMVALRRNTTEDDTKLSLQIRYDQHLAKPASISQLRDLVTFL